MCKKAVFFSLFLLIIKICFQRCIPPFFFLPSVHPLAFSVFVTFVCCYLWSSLSSGISFYLNEYCGNKTPLPYSPYDKMLYHPDFIRRTFC